MNIVESDQLSKTIKEDLPEIDGVDWRVEICERPGSFKEIRIVVSAEFSVSKPRDLTDVLSTIKSKVHEITSGGQSLLELEK